MPRLLEKSCQGIERQLERNHEEKKSVTNQSSKKIRWIVRGKQLLDIDRTNATIKLSAIRDYHSSLWNENNVELKKNWKIYFTINLRLKECEFLSPWNAYVCDICANKIEYQT